MVNFLFVLFVFLGSLLIFQHFARKRDADAFMEICEEMPERSGREINFDCENMLVSYDANTAVAVDTGNGLLCLMKDDGDSISYRVVPRSKVKTVKIEKSVARMEIGGGDKAGKMALGGLLFGIIGMIAGGATSSSKTEIRQFVDGLGVKIVLEDGEVFDIPLLEGETNVESGRYKRLLRNAENFFFYVNPDVGVPRSGA